MYGGCLERIRSQGDEGGRRDGDEVGRIWRSTCRGGVDRDPAF
jgi:hypothetical protein